MANVSGFKLVRGHTFFSPGISSGGFIIDGGAHRLEFAEGIRKTKLCRVLALEPNSNLIPTRHSSDIEVYDAALSDHDGRSTFYISSNLEGSRLEAVPGEPNSIDVDTITLETLLSKLSIENVELLKLDIEGAEYKVLNNASEECLRKIKQITIEFHQSEGANINEEYTRVKRRLALFNFVSIRCSVGALGDVLFINQSFIPFASLKLAFLRVAVPARRKFLEMREKRPST